MRTIPATTWRFWHRWLGIIACTGVLLWTFSGMLHPVLVRVQPQAASFQPPEINTHDMPQSFIAPSSIADSYHINNVSLFRLINLPEGVFYQLQSVADKSSRNFNVITGEELQSGDEHYAVVLARHYLGDFNSDINDIKLISEYGGEYDAVNRVLPVYRVSFLRPDNIRVYVNTNTSLLGTIVDDRKAIFDWLFRNLHKWDWLNSAEPLRITIALIFIFSALLTALSGLVTFFKTIKNPSVKLNFYHRWLGLTVSVVLLMSASSGGLHLIKMSIKDFEKPMKIEQSISLADINAIPELPMDFKGSGIKEWSLVKYDNTNLFRIEKTEDTSDQVGHEHHHGDTEENSPHHGDHIDKSANQAVLYLNAESGSRYPVTDHELSRNVATALTGLSVESIKEVEDIKSFNGEYGFVNKFLPVTRFNFDTEKNDSVYVHTASGTIAAHIVTVDRLEGWIFSNVHKWHFMEPIGMDARDSIMALFILCIFITASLGLILFIRRYR